MANKNYLEEGGKIKKLRGDEVEKWQKYSEALRRDRLDDRIQRKVYYIDFKLRVKKGIVEDGYWDKERRDIWLSSFTYRKKC